jgi:hypothetical protein
MVKGKGAQPREERLARALRENLKRRKGQVRARIGSAKAGATKTGPKNGSPSGVLPKTGGDA